MKRKVAVVGSVTGRCGTSALMGLLNLACFNVGGKHSGLFPANDRNPKGYFEIRGLAKFMFSLRPKCYPSYKVMPPSLGTVTKIRKKYYKQFNNLLDKEFPKQKPIALKGACLLVIPFFYELRRLYDVNVIMLHRNNEDQLTSAIKTGLCKDVETYKKLRDAWFAYEKEIINNYTFCRYLHVDYNNMIKDPVVTMKRITKFLNVSPVSKEKILEWVDPKLMNRKQYK